MTVAMLWPFRWPLLGVGAPPISADQLANASLVLEQHKFVLSIVGTFAAMKLLGFSLNNMSLMALSNKTLSGCLVSLLIGFSYFFRWKPHELSKPIKAAKTIR